MQIIASEVRLYKRTPLNSTIDLHLFAGACWLPVVWLQIQMKGMAEAAYQQGASLSARYWQYARYWEYLGYPAFIAMVVVFYLMVNKPQLWA